MNLKVDVLSQMLLEAFDCGYSGMDDGKDSNIADILEKYKIKETDDKPPEQTHDVENRIYTARELQKLPVGAVFVHSLLGKCSIQKKQGDKYMFFDNPGLTPSGFMVDGYPWELPMKRVS